MSEFNCTRYITAKYVFYLQEADMAAAPLAITSTRERVVDFSKPFMTLGIGMLMNRKDVFYRPDRAVRANPLFFLIPMTLVAWILIVIAILVVRGRKNKVYFGFVIRMFDLCLIIAFMIYKNLSKFIDQSFII